MKKRPPDGLYRRDPDTGEYELRESFEPRFHLSLEGLAAKLENPQGRAQKKKKIPWRSLLDDAYSCFWNEYNRFNPMAIQEDSKPFEHLSDRGAMEEYPWIVPLLDPIANILGPPEVSFDPANADCYGGPPFYHGIIIAWNARTGLTREGWREREIINPKNPKEPSIAIWLGSYIENASCLGQCLPHPKWKIRLHDEGTTRDRYHSLPEFIDLCLLEIHNTALLRDPPDRP